MRLSDYFGPEFRPMIDEIEPWLESQPPRQWNDFVVYVTDTTAEYKLRKADQATSACVKRKAEAIAWEQQNGTPASLDLIQRFSAPQRPGAVWIVASDAKNNLNVVECEVFVLDGVQAGEA